VLEIVENLWAVGIPPRTPLGELTALPSNAFRFAIRIDSPIHFKHIDSNRLVLF